MSTSCVDLLDMTVYLGYWSAYPLYDGDDSSEIEQYKSVSKIYEDYTILGTRGELEATSTYTLPKAYNTITLDNHI